MRRRRVRQDAPRHGIPGARRARIRRPRCLHLVRGDDRRPRGKCAVARVRRAAAERPPAAVLDYVQLERDKRTESGEYDLEGLFIRLGHAIETIQAKRVVLDTIEVLFSGLSDRLLVRAELARLFRWLKTKRVTAIVTRLVFSHRNRDRKSTRLNSSHSQISYA